MSTETAPRTRHPREAIAPARSTFRPAQGAGETPSVVEITLRRGGLLVRPAATRPPPRGKGRTGRLYALVEAEGAAGPDLAERWERRLADLFFHQPAGSVTSALLRSIQDLNDVIISENAAEHRGEQRCAGLACALVRDDEVFFAVVGRVIAFLDGPDGCVRLGRGEARPGERPLDPLGARDDVEIQMFHRVIAEPWTIVLATSGALALGGIVEALAAHPSTPVAALRRVAESSRAPRPFRGILVTSATEDDVAAEGEDVANEDDFLDGLVRRSADELRRRAADPSPPNPRMVARDSPVDRPRAERDDTFPWRTETRITPGRRPIGPHPPAPSPAAGRGPGGEARWGAASRTRGVTADDPDLDSPHRDEPPDHSGVLGVARGRAGCLGGHDRARDEEGDDEGDEEAVERIDDDTPWPRRTGPGLGGDVERSPRRGGAWIPLDPPRLAGLGAVAILLFFVGYLVVVVPVRLVQNGAAYAAAIGAASQAEGAERAALDANDPNARRQLLARASQLAEVARASQPASATIAATEARIHDEYQAATGAEVMSPTRLVDLPAPGDELILNGVSLFVLDRADSRLYRYLTNADGTAVQAVDNPVVVQRGDHLGLVTVGQLGGMAWVPTGDGRGAPALVVLDTSGFLVQDAPGGGLSVLGLRDPTDWGGVGALAAGAGDLYAVRPTAGTITVYTPQASGYDGPARSLLAAGAHPDLSDVTALAVDGDLFALRRNGAVLRLSNGAPAPDFPDTTKLFAGPPAGLVVTTGALFIGDPRGNRVVQLSREGQFQRYLTAGAYSDLLGRVRDLAASNDGSALFALTNDGVYRLDLPAIPT